MEVRSLWFNPNCPIAEVLSKVSTVPGFKGASPVDYKTWAIEFDAKYKDVKQVLASHGMDQVREPNIAIDPTRAWEKDVVKKVVEAAGISRLFDHMKNEFGIVSGFESSRKLEDNTQRSKDLKQVLIEMGYGFVPAKGVWKGASEESLFIPGISLGEIHELARMFNQEAFVHGNNGKYNIINTGSGAVELSGDVATDFHDATPEAAPDSYTETKGRKWVFKKPEQTPAVNTAPAQPADRATMVAFHHGRNMKYLNTYHGLLRNASLKEGKLSGIAIGGGTWERDASLLGAVLFVEPNISVRTWVRANIKP